MILSRTFFERKTLTIAKEIIGCYLCRKIGTNIIKLPITEVEVYDGFEDKASHASRGMTPRNKVMFGEAGRWYVYFVYGNHWLLNIVTGKTGYPAAILIRGAGEIVGPGRLTKSLGITGSLNCLRVARSSGLWIERTRINTNQPPVGGRMTRMKIIALPRIGVDYAGPIWSKKKYRFLAVK